MLPCKNTPAMVAAVMNAMIHFQSGIDRLKIVTVSVTSRKLRWFRTSGARRVGSSQSLNTSLERTSNACGSGVASTYGSSSPRR